MTGSADLLAVARRRLETIRSIPTDDCEISERSELNPSERNTRHDGDDGVGESLVELDEAPLGEAGPGVPAWRCPVAISAVHVAASRPDGSRFCATCHPPYRPSGQ